MLEVQKFLRAHTIEALEAQFHIKTTLHPSDPLVILNYSQIDSPKGDKLVQECRGLTLEIGDEWKVVARSFPRFFNMGECPEEEKKFHWPGFSTTSKEDGSLVLLYRYGDSWRVNTRGSFAQGEIAPGVGKTWERVVWDSIGIHAGVDGLPHDHTFVFELCSPYNKVVRHYPQPMLFLLTAFNNYSGREASLFSCDYWAQAIGVKRPAMGVEELTLAELQQLLVYRSNADPTFEGVVLRDKNGMRLKIKNPKYVALHHLHDNGNAFHPKRLLPLVLAGEQDELLNYFPEVFESLLIMTEVLARAKARMMLTWQTAKYIESQKDFAVFVMKHTPLSRILFQARKLGLPPEQIFAESEDLLLKVLFSNDSWRAAV
jgi:hypothetical protein